MNKISLKWVVTGMLSFVAISNGVDGMENLQVTVQGTDAVLSWPSQTGERFFVRYRPSLDAASPWTLIASGLPAASGADHTTFTHAGIVTYPPAGGGGGSGGPPPPPLALQTVSTQGLADGDNATSAPGQAMTNKAKNRGNEDDLPPMPWDPRFVFYPSESSSLMALTAAASMPLGCTGFYQVVREGVRIIGLPNNSTVSGLQTWPVEVGVMAGEVSGLTAYVNGVPLIGSQVELNALGQWVFEWNTSFTPNGVYEIRLEANIILGEPVSSAPLMVTVNNLVSFPDYFCQFFGDTLFVYAELAVPAAAFTVRMFDANHNALLDLVGTTQDGIINFGWDLTDVNGLPLSNEAFYGEFFITPLSGAMPQSPQAATAPAASFNWVKEHAWLTDGFVIAYTAKNSDGTLTMRLNSMVASGVVDILGAGNRYPLSPGNMPNADTAFHLYDNNTRDLLLGYLKDLEYRNFYFCGHGDPSCIAGVQANTKITDRLIKDLLVNYMGTAKPMNTHPYRFVFLDACSTGKGRFCEAFGIPAIQANAAYFQAANTRARAFLGFTKDTITRVPDVENRADMLSNFFSDWLRNLPLDQCVNNATKNRYCPMASSWVIYGATDLSVRTF